MQGQGPTGQATARSNVANRRSRLQEPPPRASRLVRDGARGKDGFTILEALIATALATIVTGAIFALLDPAHGVFQVQPEVSDMQQRLRVGVDSLYRDLIMAGAGMYSGAPSGPLHRYFAPVLPYRIGTTNSDPANGIFFRPDAISIIYVPSTPSQCALRDRMLDPSHDLTVDRRAGCPANDPLCGFESRMRAIIFDETGAHDVFTVTAGDPSSFQLGHRPEALSNAYAAGAHLAHARAQTYWLKADGRSETYQLMRYDADRSDLPLVDDVVGLSFEYFGDPVPPTLRRSVSDPAGPWTTYGPKPPAVDADNPADAWPAGENCVFTVDSSAERRHMPRLAVLGPATGPLVPLERPMLVDGPWCPDVNSSSRYDADLLRIRKMKVTLRVQAAAMTLRGPAGALFVRSGTSRSGSRFVPDHEVRFEVTPRNLNLGR